MGEFCQIFVSIHLTIICHCVVNCDTSQQLLLGRLSPIQRARHVLHHCARNAGLSVLKCQATDKPKALILRRGPHRDGGPWTLSRLIQLCYNPLPTRPFQPPLGALSLYLPTPSASISGRAEGKRQRKGLWGGQSCGSRTRVCFESRLRPRAYCGIPYIHRNLPFPRAKLLRSPCSRERYFSAIRTEFLTREYWKIYYDGAK